jgi:sulfite exporter TauE/SafE
MIMLIFGLGTLPTMLGLGFSTAILSLRLRSQLYRATAIVVTGVGLQLALRGLALGGQISHTSLGSVMLW